MSFLYIALGISHKCIGHKGIVRISHEDYYALLTESLFAHELLYIVVVHFLWVNCRRGTAKHHFITFVDALYIEDNNQYIIIPKMANLYPDQEEDYEEEDDTSRQRLPDEHLAKVFFQ